MLFAAPYVAHALSDLELKEILNAIETEQRALQTALKPARERRAEFLRMRAEALKTREELQQLAASYFKLGLIPEPRSRLERASDQIQIVLDTHNWAAVNADPLMAATETTLPMLAAQYEDATRLMESYIRDLDTLIEELRSPEFVSACRDALSVRENRKR